MNGDIKREWFDTDYYKVLGVPETASQKDITSTYRKLARKYHPDTNPDDPAAEERFKGVAAAYEVVGDEDQRRKYDEARRMGPMGSVFSGAGGANGQNVGFGGADISDLLGSFMGGFGQQGQPRQRPGRDQSARLTITFDEAVRGATTSISVAGPDGPRTVNLRIPAGVGQGQQLRLREKGGPGSPRGDLLVSITVGPHDVFDRDGDKLILKLPVTFAEAALGADIELPTYEGSTVKMRIPAGTQHGRTMRVKGAGPDLGDGPGDLLVHVHLAVPTNLSSKERKALEAWADLHAGAPRDHLFPH